MTKIPTIEGLRGWLAWAVVLSHLTLASGIYAKGWKPVITAAGHDAVLVFIIISGFVITHLILDKRERYLVYIVRRFMRLFPVYVATCVLGYFCMPLFVHAASVTSWGDHGWYHRLQLILDSQRDFFWSNFVMHVVMLHGAVSDRILPYSLYAFNPPAWSLSLEWQFYIVAPVVVSMTRKPRPAIFMIGCMILLCVMYDWGVFGDFAQRSLLPGAGPYFAVGIASRIIYPKLTGTLQHLATVMALLLSLIPLGTGIPPLAIWGCLYATLIVEYEKMNAVDIAVLKVWRIVMANRVSLSFGARSYSIYLSHFPILGAAVALLAAQFKSASTLEAFAALVGIVVPLTTASAYILYSGVERPGIKIGNLWAAHRTAARAGDRCGAGQRPVVAAVSFRPE